jgi:hypothetical protein
MRIYLRALGVVGLMLLMLLLGMWVGGVTAPRGGSIVSVVGSSDVKPLLIPETMESVDETPTDPPFYFHAELGAGADGAVVGREIALASRAGVRRYILSLPLPWEGEWEPIERALALVAEHAPRGRVIIELDINPPPSWLEANPSEVSSVSLNGRSFPSVGSRAWRAFAVERILAMADHVDAMASPVELVGVVLSALEKGEWFRADSYDNSEANTTAFRAWLARAYGSDEAFAEAWGAGGALLAEARVPAPPGEDGPAFLMLPVEQANADYLRYTLEDTADALGGLAESIKAKAGDGLLVYARLGPSLERGAGGVDLGRLSASRIDGIVSSVSDMDRGLGGVAGYTRAIHAALSRGKDWIVIDNTRTGIGQRNPGGEVVRPSGLRVGDLLGLYRRNFAMASLHGLSYAVSDATGTGGLHDEELWEEVGALRVASERLTSEPRDDDRVASTLSVVFDEHGGAFQRGDPSFFANALAANRDAALEAGCSLQFVLLSDVLAGRPPRSGAYLMLNAFHLNEEDRTALHSRFTAEHASVIWIYAPGYVERAAAVESIGATTRMEVRASEDALRDQSAYAFSGEWTVAGEAFGSGVSVSPAFYIEDESVDPLSTYADSELASAGIKFLEEGWTTAYVCQPTVSVGLLRELLAVVKQPALLRETGSPTRETIQRASNLVYIYARGAGERTLDLQRWYDIRDVIDPKIGWTRKRLVNIDMEAGETRLLRLTPVSAEGEDGGAAKDDPDVAE